MVKKWNVISFTVDYACVTRPGCLGDNCALCIQGQVRWSKHWGERTFIQQKVRHKKRAKTTKRSQSLAACVAGGKKGGGGGGKKSAIPYPFRRLLRWLCKQLKAGRFIRPGWKVFQTSETKQPSLAPKRNCTCHQGFLARSSVLMEGCGFAWWTARIQRKATQTS